MRETSSFKREFVCTCILLDEFLGGVESFPCFYFYFYYLAFGNYLIYSYLRTFDDVFFMTY